VGIIGGIVAAILLAPKRRQESDPGLDGATAGSGSKLLESAISGGLDLLEAAVEGYERVRERVTTATESSGLMPDERLTGRVQDELEARGVWSRRLDVTTVDGVVYLRGRELDTARADTIVNIAERMPGVQSVVDEIKRD
jgi:osmotically-inducible protein OsmY